MLQISFFKGLKKKNTNKITSTFGAKIAPNLRINRGFSCWQKSVSDQKKSSWIIFSSNSKIPQKSPSARSLNVVFEPPVFSHERLFLKVPMLNEWEKRMVLEKVECLISLSLWRNLSPVVEILSRKLRNDDQASSMWQQQKSKQTAAHATPMPHPHFSGQISSVFKQPFQEPCLLPPLYFLHRLWSHFLCFSVAPPIFREKNWPLPPRLLFTNNWISIFFWIQDATCLNTIRDLEKLSTCASQFVICWPFQTSPQSLHFL